MSSTSILMVKRMERRNRGMETQKMMLGRFLSALELLELLLMVPSTVFGLLISPRSFEVTKLRYTITIFMWRCENRKGRLRITIH